MAFDLGGSCWWWGCPFPPPRSLYLRFQLSFPFLSPSFAPFSLSLCIIYSHFLAIKMERCCRIFACSATLQCWWIILHPANWKASLSFMSALCWFTIKTYCTVLWVEGLALRELAKSKNEDEADMCTYALGSFFCSLGWGSLWVIYIWVIYICVYSLDLWRISLFIYVHCLVLYHLGFMLIFFLSTVFIMGLSCIVWVIRRSFISVSLSRTHWHTHTYTLALAPFLSPSHTQRAVTDVWTECVGCSGYRGGVVLAVC